MSPRDVLRAVGWYLRELAGETAYDRYVERLQAEHPGAMVMSRRDSSASARVPATLTRERGCC